MSIHSSSWENETLPLKAKGSQYFPILSECIIVHTIKTKKTKTKPHLY